MAIWAIPEDKIIDYSPNGDDVDSFSQKVKFCLEEIFKSLQYLHSSGGTLDDSNTTPYEIRVNRTDNCIYIRNSDNTAWVFIGEVAPYLGINADGIGGIINGGGMGKLSCGTLANRPTENVETNDLYFATDDYRLFIYDGYNWQTFLSLNFSDMLNYERYCLARSELTTIGGTSYAGKILQLDQQTGKANVDITGSPARIYNKLIDFQDLRDGHAIVYNAEKNKFVNLPNEPFPVAISGLSDGQVLVYHSSTGKFQNGALPAVGEGKSLVICNGSTTLGDYNGSAPVTVDLQTFVAASVSAELAKLTNEVSHLKRLTTNLYNALQEAELNPSGADGVLSDCFAIGSASSWHIDTERSSLLPNNGKIASVANTSSYVVTTPMNITLGTKNNASLPVTCDVIINHSATTIPSSFGVLDAEVAISITDSSDTNTDYWLVNGERSTTETFARLTKVGTYPDTQSGNYITHLQIQLFTLPLPSGLTSPEAYFKLYFKHTSNSTKYNVYSIRYMFNE